MTMQNLKQLDKFSMLLAMTLIGAVAWLVETPWAYDDNYYRLTYDHHGDEDWPAAEPEITTMRQALASVCSHTENNGRLSNISHIMLQPFGHTFEAVLLGLFIPALFACLMLLGRRAVGNTTPLSGITAVLVLWVAFPWHDSFQSLDFVINYVPPSVFVLIAIGLLPTLSAKNRMHLTIACAAGFIAAWMSEGNGAVLIVYMLCCMLLDRKQFDNTRTLAVIGCVAAGMAVNLLLGTALRTQRDSEEMLMPTIKLLIQILPQSWPFMLAVCMVALRYCTSEKSARRDIMRRFTPLVLASFAGVCMAFILGRTDRVLWSSDLFAAVAIMGCTSYWAAKVKPKIQLIAGAGFAILYSWWLLELYRWQVPVGEESRLIERIHGGRRPGMPTVVFADRVSNDEIPWYLMGIVHNPLDGWWGAYSLGHYLEPEGECAVMTLPPELEGLPFDKWPKVPGNNHLRGVWPVVAAADSIPADFVLHVGPPDANVTPINKLFILLKERRLSDESQIQGYNDIVPVIMPDGTRLYRYFHEQLPRTIARRPFLSVDTIAPRKR